MIGNALRLAADASGQTVEKPQTPPESGAKADSSDTGIGEVLKDAGSLGPDRQHSHCRWRDHGRRSSSEGARRDHGSQRGRRALVFPPTGAGGGLMFGFLDWTKIGAGAAAGAALLIAPAYFKGKAAGRDEAAVSLETSVKILRTEGEIDAEVSRSDAATLCADYGLPDDEQAECMRRVRSVSAEAGNDRLHPSERPAIR